MNLQVGDETQLVHSWFMTSSAAAMRDLALPLLTRLSLFGHAI